MPVKPIAQWSGRTILLLWVIGLMAELALWRISAVSYESSRPGTKVWLWPPLLSHPSHADTLSSGAMDSARALLEYGFRTGDTAVFSDSVRRDSVLRAWQARSPSEREALLLGTLDSMFGPMVGAAAQAAEAAVRTAVIWLGILALPPLVLSAISLYWLARRPRGAGLAAA